MKAWIVYLLRCCDGTLYCGITNDLPRRLGAHGRGGVKYTRGRLPVEVVYVEPAADRSAAHRPRTKEVRGALMGGLPEHRRAGGEDRVGVPPGAPEIPSLYRRVAGRESKRD